MAPAFFLAACIDCIHTAQCRRDHFLQNNHLDITDISGLLKISCFCAKLEEEKSLIPVISYFGDSAGQGQRA